MLSRIGWATYIFYAAWNVVALAIVYFFFVETKGKSLEEIDAMFGDVSHADQGMIQDQEYSSDDQEKKGQVV